MRLSHTFGGTLMSGDSENVYMKEIPIENIDLDIAFRLAWHILTNIEHSYLGKYSDEHSLNRHAIFVLIDGDKKIIMSLETGEDKLILKLKGENEQRIKDIEDNIAQQIAESIEDYKTYDEDKSNRIRMAIIGEIALDKLISDVIKNENLTNLQYNLAHAREMMIKSVTTFHPITLEISGWLTKLREYLNSEIPEQYLKDLMVKSKQWKKEASKIIDELKTA